MIWRRRSHVSTTPDAFTLQVLQRSIDALGAEFRTYTATTDVKLELYGVLIPKVLVDLTHALREMTTAQRDLADRMDLLMRTAPAKPAAVDLVREAAVG